MTTRAAPRVQVPEGGVGESPARPDGVPKLRGEFDYAQDLGAEGMLWATTVRSPHARARIVSIDIAPALAMGGVQRCSPQTMSRGGQRSAWNTPTSRCSPATKSILGRAGGGGGRRGRDTARRAAAASRVRYEELDALTDPEEADRRDEVFRRLQIRRGDQGLRGSVVVEGSTRWGCRTRPRLGPRPVSPCLTAMVVSISTPPASTSTSTTSRSSPASGSSRSGAGPPDGDGWRLRGQGGCQPPHPSLPARPAHRAAGEDGLSRARSRSPAMSTAIRRGCGTGTRPIEDGRLVTGRGPDPDRRWGVRLDDICGGGQRLLLRRRALSMRLGRRSTAWGPAPTTRRAGRCGGSERCSPALRYEAQMDRLAAALGMDPLELREPQRPRHR